VEVDTRHLLAAKIDLLSESDSRRTAMLASVMRRLDREGDLSSAITYLLNAALRISGPRTAGSRSSDSLISVPVAAGTEPPDGRARRPPVPDVDGGGEALRQ
jgi:hypothetical protein